MGCFNVSCGVSAISMYCDDAVLVPLLPAPYAIMRGEKLKDGGLRFHGSNIVTNEGSQSLFFPMTLPLFGNVDSYGRLENIQKDANTECIEKFFEMKIEDFAEAVAVGERFEMPKGWQPYDHKLLKSVCGMFIHREIWDTFSTVSLDEWGKSDISVYDDCDLVDEVLELIGFKLISENKETDKNRYYRLLKREDLPQVEIHSDGTWIEWSLKGSKKRESVYHLFQLIEGIEKKTGFKFPAKEIALAKKTTKYEIYLKKSFKTLAAKAERRKQLEESLKAAEEKNDAELINIYKQMLKSDIFLSFNNDVRYNIFSLGGFYNSVSQSLFDSIYSERLADISSLLMQHKTVEKNMFAVNRLYMPTFNGYQHGNHYMSAVLYKKSLDIVKKKNKEREDDE